MKNKFFFISLLLFFAIFLNGNIQVNATTNNGIIQKKVNEISNNIRCLVCRNQSIYDSNSDFAKDIKTIIRSKVENGEDDKLIYEYLKSKYGDFILFNPPFQKNTLLLWFLPFTIILFGIFFTIYKYINLKAK